jgi:excinuclease ABC subunit B
LRSEQSLIQTIGRAARNLQGKAILYADKITGSMQRAMDETERRRALQLAHNNQYGVIPKSINKAVADIMEGAYANPGKGKRGRKVAEAGAAYDIDSGQPIKNIAAEIKRLEQAMYQHARNLEFEEAANIRDRLGKLRERSLVS